MTVVDERVLEFLDENGNHQPSQMSDQLSETGVDLDYHPKYLGKRCRLLAEHGMIVNLGNGLYSITEIGQGYLSGDLDAGKLEPPEE